MEKLPNSSMAIRKTMTSVDVESSMHSPPSMSSPLRRRTMTLQKEGPVNFFENDDEAERQARRRESISLRNTDNPAGTDSGRRRSVSLSLAQLSAPEMTARVNQYIKLNTENKISIKNAFSLEMIDFMNYMVKKQRNNSLDLQVASTSLDVSTKIYGFRVDGVHTAILKMVGGLDKHAVAEESKDENEAEVGVVKKKKKRNKQNIISTVEALKGTIETASATSLMMTEGDLQTTDMLYQVGLPHHLDSGFYLHQFNDIILDTTVETGVEGNVSESEQGKVIIPNIDSIQDSEICPSLVNFEFHGWSAEDNMDDENSEDDNDNRFQFDLNASLPGDDDPDPVGQSYFDMYDEHENVETCQNIANPVENIVDFRQAVLAPGPSKPLEYTFIQKDTKMHWAGPSHWKLGTFHKNILRTSVMETCRQTQRPKCKNLELSYTKDAKAAINEKMLPSKSIKIQAKAARMNWHEDKITLPEDIHYNISQTRKLYLHPELTVCHVDQDKTHTTELNNDNDYDYNNENDTSDYCPNVDNPDCEANNHNDDNDGEFGFDDGGTISGTQKAFTGENLVAAPKQVNKISIQYSTRPRKIDMRQLKKSIWKSLVSSGQDDANMDIQKAVDEGRTNKVNGVKHFNEVYKDLPNRLSKNNAEALSFPVAMVSLLHLANEKTLKLSNVDDFSDILVEQN